MQQPGDSTNLAGESIFQELHDDEYSFKIKLPPISMNLRRSGRHRTSSAGASGSEYRASEKSVEMQEEPPAPPPEPPVEFTQSRSGRRVLKKTYVESSDSEVAHPEEMFDDEHEDRAPRNSRPSRSRRHVVDIEDEDEGEAPVGRQLRKRTRLGSFIVEDEDEKMHTHGRYPTRSRNKKAPPKTNGSSSKPQERQSQPSQRARRLTRRNASRADQEEDFFPEPHTSSGASADADGSLDDAPHTSSDLEPDPEPEPEHEPEVEEEVDGRPYALRQRQKINYAIPPPLEDMPKPPPKGAAGRNGGRTAGYHGGGHGRAGAKGRTLGWSASGAELGRWMGMPGDDSDSDYATRTPRKPFGGIAPFGTGAVAGAAGSGMIGDLAAGGTPSNLGKIGDTALADADPLGVNTNVTFDEVGGLDDHIHALKEMTLLPLLYPEVFQRFNVTPPRGVLFHGPPGTGKTLLARALAASCRTGGRQISFFMRKGADCLSKWVGEAERQLRLLFEEARNSQPSIIFFDEIDGLAPVRSSKQDQIHASIVSTLLALMDGMDGRGQVVVIGATNRPDAVDPALRRPGRFDREFYFGLPGLDAREKILSIMTKKWEGWGAGDGDSEVEVKERIKGLAKLTKGYGGADLRALCTEAALNAIQRRYPQVYKTNDRLLLKPETIGVGLRDFMISIKKLVPSTARSSSSAATPLPTQFIPVLSDALEKVKEVIQRVLPLEKKLSALEEAEFEDDGGEEGALDREMLSQAMQTLRVYRPRVIIHGPLGMGQAYIGAAALHHLEGYHVQSLELGTLMSDSTRTVEAAIVQLFIEAKRNQPSVIYIPSLVGWCAAVSETSRSTVRAMLDTLAPTDPILLLAVVDGPFSSLPRDVKAWFGPTRDNRIQLSSPSSSQREAFFDGLLKDIQRPPNQFADGMKRRKRILEKLPIAPPIEPRKPTASELALQEENDQRIITLLKYRLGPILTELKRKFKRFTKRATEEYNFDFDEGTDGLDTVTVTAVEVHQGPNGVIDITDDHTTQPVEGSSGPMNGVIMEQQQILRQLPPLFDMDLERMHAELFKGRYLTPQDFLDDVGKMVHNADVRSHEDLDRLYRAQAMFTAAQVSIQEFDPQLRLECERMAVRERQRREQHKKSKGKEKAHDSQVNGGAPVGARRSARNNGQQPELSITDPVKLERRLKRQRGEECSGGDSHGSEEELNGAGGENRDAKRTRIIDDDDDDRDPLDTIGATPGSAVRSHVVRFATGTIEPMAPLTALSPTPARSANYHDTSSMPFDYNNTPAPSTASYNHVPGLSVSYSNISAPSVSYDVGMPAPPASYNNIPAPSAEYHNHPPPFHPDQMAVDQSPSKPSGFDPSLLNPMPSTQGAFHLSPFISRPNDSSFNFPMMSVDPADPFTTHTAQGQPMSFTQMLAKTPTPPPLNLAPRQPLPSRRTPTPHIRTPEPERVLTPAPAPVLEPMVIEVERTPSPPLPDFHVDISLIEDLRQTLRNSTASLTIEQLEQLRATCLGNLWRHRSDWDRDGLVRELQGVVKDFVEEVSADCDSEDE